LLAYVLAIIVLLVAGLLAVFLAPLFHLQGAGYAGFIILVSLVGIAAAITIIVLHRRAKKEREQLGEDAGAAATSELDLMLADANRKLRSSQQGAKSLESMPLLYLLGEAGSAKTTTVLKSGLDPELLAGSATSDGDQAPTAVMNLWFTRSAALLELGHSVRQSLGLLGRLVHRTRARAYRSAFGSGAAPRAVIVCVSADQLLAGDAGQSLMASARATGAQLREISRLLGMPVPVYVIVTKLDRVPHFAEYVRNLSDAEVRQVLGLPLPRADASAGVYAEKASRMLAGQIDGLIYQLGEFRVEMLDRENDPAQVPSVYEFPRELGKLRKNLKGYLVEICKPSQLSANPYLRGFYFTGVRARVVERAAVAAAPAAVEMSAPQDAGATQFLDLSAMRAAASRTAAAPPPMTSTRVPQWAFLPRLLPEVILGDRSALTATKQSTPARLFRRILYGTLAFLFALYTVFLFISYLNNNALERRIQNDAVALPRADATAISLPDTRQLSALDDLRKTIVDLDEFQQNGPPFTYRFGLYQGDKLAIEARNVYFDRFRPMLLNPAQNNFLATMRPLPDAPPAQIQGDSNAYLTAYNALKAYLITTSPPIGHPEKSDPSFLTPVFRDAWVNSRAVDDTQKNLATQQIDFYARELLRRPPYQIAPDDHAVDHTQTYLSQFLGETRIYQNMLADGDKAGTLIDFNRKYPDAVRWVRDDRTVRGAFSRSGFDAMDRALKNPAKYAQGEPWVLGDKRSKLPDMDTLSAKLRTTYETDYVAAWTAFVQNAHVARYGNLDEASAELGALSGPASPILALFYTVSHNTAVPDDSISKVFQPAQVVVDGKSESPFTGQGIETYLPALQALQAAVDKVKPNPKWRQDAAVFQPVLDGASDANKTINAVSLKFFPDPDRKRQIETIIKNRMTDPIQFANDLAPSPGAGANAQGAKVCDAVAPLLGKFPFAPNSNVMANLSDVNAALAPESGALWTSYGPDLKSALVLSGTQYVPAPNPPGRVNPKFVEYFNHLARISATLYPAGAKSSSFSFDLRFIPGGGVSSANFIVDNQRMTSGSNTQRYTWVGGSAQSASLVADNVGTNPDTGTWAVFQLVRDARISRLPGGAYRLDYLINNAVTIQGRAASGQAAGTKTATFELSGPGADFLAGEGLAGLSCVKPVIQK
jgi:type VI secretion system protein ImpL